MPFRSHVTGAIAPTTTVDSQEKQEQPPQEVPKKPILLSVRASDYFIFSTAAIGLFTSVSI